MATLKKTILSELEDILTQALELEEESETADFQFDVNNLPKNSKLSAIELRQQNLKFPGQDTSHYNKLSWKAQVSRKVFHVECDSCYLAEIKRPAQIAKEANIFKIMWGKHGHISEVIDKDSSPSEIKCLIRVAQVNGNYQCSMLLEDIIGITDLNEAADLIQPGVYAPLQFSLRMVLLCFVQLSNGHKLFA